MPCLNSENLGLWNGWLNGFLLFMTIDKLYQTWWASKHTHIRCVALGTPLSSHNVYYNGYLPYFLWRSFHICIWLLNLWNRSICYSAWIWSPHRDSNLHSTLCLSTIYTKVHNTHLGHSVWGINNIANFSRLTYLLVWLFWRHFTHASRLT